MNKNQVGLVPIEAKKPMRPFESLARRLTKRFGHRIDVDPYPKEFTSEFLANAAKYNMRPIFLPGENITEDCQLKKWVKPEPWFYKRIKDGKIKPYDGCNPTTLRRGWYLADFSIGVDYSYDGTQVFPNDPWALLITQLREKGKIGKSDKAPINSRFAITHREWENPLLIHMASKLMVTRTQIRLERAIEFNAIGNLYDPNRDRFCIWEWFADHFKVSDRLIGGCRGRGGLSHVYFHRSDYRVDGFAGRPLVSFVSC